MLESQCPKCADGVLWPMLDPHPEGFWILVSVCPVQQLPDCLGVLGRSLNSDHPSNDLIRPTLSNIDPQKGGSTNLSPTDTKVSANRAFIVVSNCS